MPELELKRKAEEGAMVPVKRPRNEMVAVDANLKVMSAGPSRTSELESPIMLLTGHQSEIFCLKFHPEGGYIASAGFDRQIYLWNVYGECENFAALSGHTGAVMDLKFSTDGSTIYTASTDKTVALWDAETGCRIKKLKGHTSFVNSCDTARRGPQLVCSGGDDCTIKVWDPRKRGSIQTFQNTYQVTAVSFNDTSEQILSGGIDNVIKVWDIRKAGVLYAMKGHIDTVTGLSLSPDGSYVLSAAMDNSLRIWDVRPFAPQDRFGLLMEAKLPAGSADRFVYIWDTTTRRIMYKLPGHNGSINEVAFHPNEPIVASCSSDRQIYLGEIE
ncbi:U5 small nuclear ribonucleoprotein [Nymphon striatum]|nr:U5 small nuclear ribonucleoprotein [Nymphon striatum]